MVMTFRRSPTKTTNLDTGELPETNYQPMTIHGLDLSCVHKSSKSAAWNLCRFVNNWNRDSP